MSLNLTILYRGMLSSCNYDCHYCPFAKHWESPAELLADRKDLARFCNWASERHDDDLAIFFTPWGEALVRPWYRDAIESLSHLPNVRKVAVQTNLSCRLDWLDAADVEKIGLWCTYHPEQTTLDAFLRQCGHLDRLRVRYSVGCVGLREHLPEIERLRKRLPPSVYLWINAYKSQPDYYEERLIDALESIDPLFGLNNAHHQCFGKSCRCGASVFSVDGAGNMRRCHFVDQVIGNIYDAGFERALKDSPCPNRACGCHIGYVHLDHLQLYPLYGDGVLERIPAIPIWRSNEVVKSLDQVS
jgi:MoaA/NifB/PqqE/SkfB family radical SAM enzyme